MDYNEDRYVYSVKVPRGGVYSIVFGLIFKRASYQSNVAHFAREWMLFTECLTRRMNVPRGNITRPNNATVKLCDVASTNRLEPGSMEQSLSR